MPLPNHRERQLMQNLRSAGWVKSSTLPSGAKVISNLLSKGWIEQSGQANDILYRITEEGIAAKRAPVPIGTKRSN